MSYLVFKKVAAGLVCQPNCRGDPFNIKLWELMILLSHSEEFLSLQSISGGEKFENAVVCIPHLSAHRKKNEEQIGEKNN